MTTPIPEGSELAVITDPLEVHGCDFCPLDKTLDCHMNNFMRPCTAAAKKAGLPDPDSYFFVDKLRYVTWRLTR